MSIAVVSTALAEGLFSSAIEGELMLWMSVSNGQPYSPRSTIHGLTGPRPNLRRRRDPVANLGVVGLQTNILSENCLIEEHSHIRYMEQTSVEAFHGKILSVGTIFIYAFIICPSP